MGTRDVMILLDCDPKRSIHLILVRLHAEFELLSSKFGWKRTFRGLQRGPVVHSPAKVLLATFSATSRHALSRKAFGCLKAKLPCGA